jgi:hypothetical protein
LNSKTKRRIYDSSVDFQTLALSGPFDLMFMSIGPEKYEPGAPAALPGKIIFEKDYNPHEKVTIINKDNLGPPVVGPSFFSDVKIWSQQQQ